MGIHTINTCKSVSDEPYFSMQIPFFSKYFCILIFSAFLITISASAHSHCLEYQKTLLLELRRELTFNSSLSTKLVTWDLTENCCLWTGVECDGEGHVISLQLDHEAISGAIKESSNLFNFRHLRRLNLAYNNFDCQIPSAIHHLTHLTHLNLSHANFSGQVPLGLSLLTNLVSLDLSSTKIFHVLQPRVLHVATIECFEYHRIEIPNLKIILQNLLGLKELYLDHANISIAGGYWGYIISSTLPNLEILSLRDCGLSGPLHPSLVHLRSLSVIQLDENDLSTTSLDFFANFSNLTALTLSHCSLIDPFLGIIFQVPTLQVLDIAHNPYLSGTLPDFPNRSLRWIRLSSCNVSGSLIHFSMLKKVTHVELKDNKLTGSLSSINFGRNSNLAYLDLSHNLLSGVIPVSLFGVPSLIDLRLGFNSFRGRINEVSTLYSSNLEVLDLRYNRLDGPLPVSLIKLKKLQLLDLSNNLFDGSNINSSMPAFTKLTGLFLRSCNLRNFPNLINHSLTDLDLSYNHIAGEISSWIWDGPLLTLDLSFNSLVGFQKPFDFPRSLRSLFLNSNKLQGGIPVSLCNITYLSSLDLSNNSLSGSLPPCLLEDLSLTTLNLGTNKINGEIPDTFSSGCNLETLDLKQNNFEGKIPPSLANCKSLEIIILGSNKIEDSFPCMLPSSLHVLVMRSNKLHGEVRCHRSWPNLQIIDLASNNLSGNLHSLNFLSWKRMLQDNHAEFDEDRYVLFKNKVTLMSKGQEWEYRENLYMLMIIDLSCNNFQGVIPNVVGNLKSLIGLNLSHNALTGTIPKSFGKLNHLESLDLSNNLLTGEIPTELASLTFLGFLNLSYNKLVGAIPPGSQFKTFSISSFLGNMGLCGFPLTRHCNDTNENKASSRGEQPYEKEEIEWVYVSAALGFGAGFGSTLWLLFGCKSISMRFTEKVEIVLEHTFIKVQYGTRRCRKSVQRDQVRKQ